MALSDLVRKGKFQQGLLVLLTTVVFLPFIDKAYHIDDPLYIWIARQILQHPFDFFGFSANWYGHPELMAKISNNPPLFSYYQALFGALFGWSEPAMHLAQLVPSLAVVVGTYHLACQMRANPLHASLLTVITPIYLLCGTSVMVDMTMTAFYVWALFFWLKGLDDGAQSPVLLLIAAILAAAACLTKYFGISLLPLMALFPLWRRIPLKRWIFYLLLPLVFLGLYQWWTVKLYGFGHVSDASNFAATSRERNQANYVKALLQTLSFTGGGLLFPVVFSVLTPKKRGWALEAGVLSGVTVLLMVLGSNSLKGFSFSWSGTAQLLLFVAAGIGVLFTAAADFRREQDAGSLLLLCWIGGTIFFNVAMNPFVAGRYLLPIVPAVAILFARRAGTLTGWRFSAIGFACGCILIISLMVTVADYRYANEVRSVAKEVHLVWQDRISQHFFLGHWGMQYYLEGEGAVAFDKRKPQAMPGDLVLFPTFGSNAWLQDMTSFQFERQLSLSPLSWLSTFNPGVGAGFHSSLAGPLPFAFGKVQPDSFNLYKAL